MTETEMLQRMANVISRMENCDHDVALNLADEFWHYGRKESFDDDTLDILNDIIDDFLFRGSYPGMDAEGDR